MYKLKNITFLLFFVLSFSNLAEAQVKKIYNEQQLIMLEQQGLLNSIDESQISESAKESKIYQRFKGLEVDDPRFRKREKCKKSCKKKNL